MAHLVSDAVKYFACPGCMWYNCTHNIVPSVEVHTYERK